MKRNSLFKCPVCSGPLVKGDTSYFCEKGHSFDIARRGYVNLLLPSHKGSGDPGDSREMLKSRRDFLNKGYYSEFSERLNDAAAVILNDEAAGIRPDAGGNCYVLDAGCGEGYYTVRMFERLSATGSRCVPHIYGIDVSKDAVHMAAGRAAAAAGRTAPSAAAAAPGPARPGGGMPAGPEISFAVASSYHVPIMPGCMDCVVCVFAPRDEREFSRVLKPEGRLVVAAPGPRHLYSLRKELYESPEVIGQKGTVGEGFELERQLNVNYTVRLENTEDILNLLAMTPYSRHTREREVLKLKNMNEFSTEVDINIRIYRKVRKYGKGN